MSDKEQTYDIEEEQIEYEDAQFVERDYKNAEGTKNKSKAFQMRNNSYSNSEKKYKDFRRKTQRKLQQMEKDIEAYNNFDVTKLANKDRKKFEEQKKNLESKFNIVLFSEERKKEHRINSFAYKPIKILKKVVSKCKQLDSFLFSSKKENDYEEINLEEFSENNIKDMIKDSFENVDFSQEEVIAENIANSFEDSLQNGEDSLGLKQENIVQDELINPPTDVISNNMNISKNDESSKNDTVNSSDIEKTELFPIKEDSIDDAIASYPRENIIVSPERVDLVQTKEPSALEKMTDQTEISANIDELSNLREVYMNEIKRREQLRQEAEAKKLKEAEAKKEAERAEVELKEKLKQASEKLVSIREQSANLEREIQESSTEEQIYIGKKQEAMKNAQELEEMLSGNYTSKSEKMDIRQDYEMSINDNDVYDMFKNESNISTQKKGK